MKKTFKALTRLSSKKHGDILPGEEIDLSHASDADIAVLLERGAIEPVEAKRPTKPAPISEDEGEKE